jgi:hypothetical protein
MVRFKRKIQIVWRYWCKALGEKASPCSKQSDIVALIRTIIFLSYLTTNAFIIANAIRHWNDKPPLIIEIYYEKQ